MKLTYLYDDMAPKAILVAPGFKKKGLAHYHWEPSFRCAAGCLYCSTNAGIPMQFSRKRLMRLAAAQIPGVRFDEEQNVALGEDGQVYDPTKRPEVTILWNPDEAYAKLEAQIEDMGPNWGAGRTLQVCQLVDPLFGPPVTSGLTLRALQLIFTRTKWRVRLLTKSDLAARSPWLELWLKYPGRVVVGLSLGSLDAEWAGKMEPGTSAPYARARAIRRLQDEGVATFGMFCPIFPNVSFDAAHMRRLFEAVRPERCETIWAEPANDRDCADVVREVYAVGTEWRDWYDRVYPPAVRGKRPPKDTHRWSIYATQLYRTLREAAIQGGWLDRLIYLLYEDDIAAGHALQFADWKGVSLQSKAREDGKSVNPYLAALQASKDDGRTLAVAGPNFSTDKARGPQLEIGVRQ